MAIAPQTQVFLLKSPIKLDNKNQLTFSNSIEQRDYFSKLEKLEVGNFTYQRKDNIIRFPMHIDEIIKFNYVMYQNENYTNKWFYAFITNMTYINDNMTEIRIATDVFQTWQFDLNYKASFIEREHIEPSEDIPGANLVPEGLETGEFIVGGTANIDGLSPIYVLAYARDPEDDGLTSGRSSGHGINLNGIPTGLFYWVGTPKMLFGLLDSIAKKGFQESVVAIFSVPCIAFVGFNGWTIESMTNGNEKSFWILDDFTASKTRTTLVSTPETLDAYKPNNAKLRTYPYMYLGYNPIAGNEKIYRYEDFRNGTPVFDIISEINPNPTVCLIPQNYRGQNGNSLSDIAILNGYPQIAWVSDYFSGWLAQNSNIINLQMAQEQFNYEVGMGQKALNQISSTANALGSIATGNIAGGIGSFASSSAQNVLGAYSDSINHEYYIKNQMAQIEKQSMLPNTAHMGTSATLLGYNLINYNIFTRYTIKYEFARRIDEFFDMYGYMTNKVKVPNLNNRPNWNYIKTIGANILGDIPQLDLEQIKNMFNNGITLWHNPNTFLDYNQNNK